MSNKTNPIVGIDLGTTNSVVAAVIDGIPTVLEEDSEKILPSVVAINQAGKLITGVVARNQLAAFPDRTIASVKRRMGTMDKISLGDQQFTPPEVSAMILRRLRDRASLVLGTTVSRAVVTVPAFFDENQRQATREAGELAGLKIERIINEPTAATLVYHTNSDDLKNIVVYDFGGGTFDVSVVRMEMGVIEVLSSHGDTKLGGDDLDLALVDFVADQFESEHGIDLRAAETSKYRLIQSCEKAKIRLSNEATVQIIEEFIAEKDGQPLNLICSVNRSDFEDLIERSVDRTVECIDEALRSANLTVDQIDDLVLVGGSTRIPMVQERLRKEFQREPSRAIDPDLAVALGAATQAAMLDGENVGQVLVDVSGHTLGIEVLADDSFFERKMEASPIIRRNTPLPASYEQVYHKTSDEQNIAEINVLQGESTDIDKNMQIGSLTVDLESGGGERSKVVVKFDLGLDGTLNVTTKQPATGITKKLLIQNALSQFQSDEREAAEERLGKMFDESEEMFDHTQFADGNALESGQPVVSNSTGSDGGIATSDAKFTTTMTILEKAAGLKSVMTSEDLEEVEDLESKIKEAMSQDEPETVKVLADELEDILFYVE